MITLVSVGAVPNTADPLPVSFDNTPERSAEVDDARCDIPALVVQVPLDTLGIPVDADVSIPVPPLTAVTIGRSPATSAHSDILVPAPHVPSTLPAVWLVAAVTAKVPEVVIGEPATVNHDGRVIAALVTVPYPVHTDPLVHTVPVSFGKVIVLSDTVGSANVNRVSIRSAVAPSQTIPVEAYRHSPAAIVGLPASVAA